MTFSITTHSIAYHYAEPRNVKCHVLFLLMLNVVMLNVVMLNVVMLIAVMLSVVAPLRLLQSICNKISD
jgi:hypothetical protein